MNHRTLSRRPAHHAVALLLFVFCGVLTGCGGSDFQTTDSGTPVQPSGAAVATPTPAQVGKIQLNAVLGKKSVSPVPANVTQYRYTGFDVNGKQQYASTVDKAASVTLSNVPVSVVSLKYELLASGQVVGSGVFAVVVTAGQIFVVNDPPFDPVVVGSNKLVAASTPYTMTGADAGLVKGGVVNGTLQFDGNGGVTGGQIVRMNANVVPPVPETFNVSAGTYSISSSRNFTATLTTDRYPLTMSGQVSLKPAGGAIYSVVYGDNGSTDAMTAVVTLQVQSSGFGNASLSGAYASVGFEVSPFSANVGYNTGTLQFDGAGKVTGGTLTTAGGTALTVRAGSYAVAANGTVTATINFSGLGSVALSGAVGADSVLALAGVAPTQVDHIFVMCSPKPSVVGVVNVQPVMESVGLRSISGVIRGQALFNAGNNTITGGQYDEFDAIVAPISTTHSTFQAGSFTVTQAGDISGSRGAVSGDQPFQLVGGVFTVSQSVFFGGMQRAQGSALSSDQYLMILAK